MFKTYRRLIENGVSKLKLRGIQEKFAERTTPRENIFLACKILMHFPFLKRGSRRQSLRWGLGLFLGTFWSFGFSSLRYERLYTRIGYIFFRGKRNASKLVIAFSGRAYRVMMPSAVFLSHLARERSDLLLLYPRSRSELYLRGVRGLGDDLDGTITGIIDLISPLAYEKVTVIGTSGGAVPALYCAPGLKAEGIAVVGPTSVGVQGPSGVTWDTLFRAWSMSDKEEGLPRLTVTTGDRARKDCVNAEEILKKLPGAHVRIADSGHNPLWKLVKTRRFSQWLGDVLFEK